MAAPKKDFEPHLPHASSYRPQMGFFGPPRQLAARPLAERTRPAPCSARPCDTGYFKPEDLAFMSRNTLAPARLLHPLWSLLMFEAFLPQRRKTRHRRMKPSTSVHVVYSFALGGLENVIVQLIIAAR